MKAWKYSGQFLIATGIIHNTLGFVMGWDTLTSIIKAGFVNSINSEMDRNAIFWFLFTGFMMMVLGSLMLDSIKANGKPLPITQDARLRFLDCFASSFDYCFCEEG